MPFGYLSLNLLSFYSEEWTRPQPRSGPFLWPWNPPDWRKWSQVKVTCLLQSTYSVQFSAKCLLPKANSQKFLYNSSPSVCDCSLILCASKTEFWPKKKSLCSLFQGDGTVTSNKLAVSRRKLCFFYSVTLLFYCGNSCQVHSFNLYSQVEGCKHLKKKQKNFFPFSFHLSFLFLHNGSGIEYPLCAFYWFFFKAGYFFCPGGIFRDRTCL